MGNWYDRYEDDLRDKENNPLSFEDAWSEFVYLWPKVKWPKRETLRRAIREATMHPYPEEAARWSDERYKLLAGTCRELQRLKGDQPFFLSSYDAGEIMGKSQTVGHKALNMFVAEGILEVVEKGTRWSATYYRYSGQSR